MGRRLRPRTGELHVKKGRHRRFEEARAFKFRTTELAPEPCAECGADPEDDHAPWCLATEDDGLEEDGLSPGPPEEAHGAASAGDAEPR
jgi:hypothetical protein